MRLCIYLTIGLLAGIAAAGDALPRQTQTLTVDGERWALTLPAGMQLELLTDRLDAPRLMTFLPNGELLIVLTEEEEH